MRSRRGSDDPPMTTTDYLIDSVLVLLVLLQIKERPMTRASADPPADHPRRRSSQLSARNSDAGNDLPGRCVRRDRWPDRRRQRPHRDHESPRRDGDVTSERLGVRLLLGAGHGLAVRLRLVDHPRRRAPVAHFSANHSITSTEAWTVALLAMAVFEVCGRTLVMALRWRKGRRQRTRPLVRSGPLA